MDPAAVLEEGRVIQVLSPNWDGLKPWDCGLWSETEPPPELTGLREPQRYLQAMRRINTVHREKVRFRSDMAEACLTGTAFVSVIVCSAAGIWLMARNRDALTVVSVLGGLVSIYYEMFMFWKKQAKRILGLLQKAVGGANALLWEEELLIGCESNVELLVVRVPLSACRGRLGHRFDSALRKYSCAYVLSLAQRHKDSAPPSEKQGHLQGAPCFCQFALKRKCCGCFC